MARQARERALSEQLRELRECVEMFRAAVRRAVDTVEMTREEVDETVAVFDSIVARLREARNAGGG